VKKTLTKKYIKGQDYYYLAFRRGGKLISEYLGSITSIKYKKYLFSLTLNGGSFGVEKARRKNFASGVPVCYVEDGFLVYEYRNGVKEILNSKRKVLKVVVSHGG
jgi:hypothetical protein